MEKQILDLFLYHNKLKFNEIQKFLKNRSNKIAYHLKKLLKRGILGKKQEYYYLSEASEYLIPYLSEKNPVLSIILIHVGDKNRCFLNKRNKRPFKNFLALPGGRILTKESINDACSRLMKEKFNILVKLNKVHSVSIEHLKKQDKIIYTYFLIFVSAETKQNLNLTDIKKNKENIITSDYRLLKEDLNKTINIKTINTSKI